MWFSDSCSAPLQLERHSQCEGYGSPRVHGDRICKHQCALTVLQREKSPQMIMVIGKIPIRNKAHRLSENPSEVLFAFRFCRGEYQQLDVAMFLLDGEASCWPFVGLRPPVLSRSYVLIVALKLNATPKAAKMEVPLGQKAYKPWQFYRQKFLIQRICPLARKRQIHPEINRSFMVYVTLKTHNFNGQASGRYLLWISESSGWTIQSSKRHAAETHSSNTLSNNDNERSRRETTRNIPGERPLRNYVVRFNFTTKFG